MLPRRPLAHPTLMIGLTIIIIFFIPDPTPLPFLSVVIQFGLNFSLVVGEGVQIEQSNLGKVSGEIFTEVGRREFCIRRVLELNTGSGMVVVWQMVWLYRALKIPAETQIETVIGGYIEREKGLLQSKVSLMLWFSLFLYFS